MLAKNTINEVRRAQLRVSKLKSHTGGEFATECHEIACNFRKVTALIIGVGVTSQPLFALATWRALGKGQAL